MESPRKNKSLFIDKEALFALYLCKEGLLAPINHLMNENEMQQSEKNQILPLSFILAPAGKRNQEILQNVSKGETLSLICDHQVCGELVVDSTFCIDKKQRLMQITGGDIYSKKAQDIYKRLGDFAVCGDYELYPQITYPINKGIKETILQIKKNIQASSITAMMLDVSPITRIHERIFRLILDENELLVLFLFKKQKEDLLSFQIRKQCLEYVIENYLPKNRIIIFPLNDIYLFEGTNGILLNAIISQNLSCDKMVIGETHPNLAFYYEKQKVYSIFDTTKEIKIRIKFLSEFVYCQQCKTIVSVKTCPHGKHHHINYHTRFIQGILQSGLIPPTILVRKEVSAKILAYLFPNRFSNLIKQFGTMFADNGIITEQNEEDFYIKLSLLYQTHSLN
ncbi:sulfate adenylyltransferase [Helicobacter sp.]|uniref:sulfate adenylyltransferase n=1 Tax=Helicobacter sp. TaxID=218 RepID=UPI002582701E|nr:sulfate adenylyltransferase [Helicobacter sp.]MCI7046632.1 sulfate adenylyltransferase [Helicobacter sp.]